MPQPDGETLHVYAVGRRGERDLEGIRGIDEATVEAVAVDDLDAFVSRHAGGPPGFAPEAFVRHDAVCSALMDGGPVAPVRFGAVFSDVAPLRASIAERREALREALGRVEGCVELGVRVFRLSAATLEPAPTGAAYLRSRLDERRADESAASTVDEHLRALSKDRRARALTAPGVAAGLSYLVPRANVEPFRTAVAALDDARPELELVCTGPWPPYSFVGEDT